MQKEISCFCGCTTFVSYNGRKNAMCENCKSLERTRALFHHLASYFFLNREPVKILECASHSGMKDAALRLFPISEYSSFDIKDRSSNDFKASIYNIPLNNDEYDIFISSHVFEHLENPDMALKEIIRVVKKDGIILTMIPFEDKEDNISPIRYNTINKDGHIWKFNKKSFKQYLDSFYVDIENMIFDISEISNIQFGDIKNQFIYCSKIIKIG